MFRQSRADVHRGERNVIIGWSGSGGDPLGQAYVQRQHIGRSESCFLKFLTCLDTQAPSRGGQKEIGPGPRGEMAREEEEAVSGFVSYVNRARAADRAAVSSIIGSDQLESGCALCGATGGQPNRVTESSTKRWSSHFCAQPA